MTLDLDLEGSWSAEESLGKGLSVSGNGIRGIGFSEFIIYMAKETGLGQLEQKACDREAVRLAREVRAGLRVVLKSLLGQWGLQSIKPWELLVETR